MASVNKAIILGRLGKDPELRSTGSGKSVASFSMATNETWKDQSGEQQERTDWHNIVAWGKTAELCAEYLKKGREAFIEGRIQTRSYEKDGQTRYMTEIVADRVQFIGGNNSSNNKRGSSFTGGGSDVPF